MAKQTWSSVKSAVAKLSRDELAHYFEGISWTDGVGSAGSSLTVAALQTDVNMNSQGTMFEESSKLVLGAEHFNCKERIGKPALRRRSGGQGG